MHIISFLAQFQVNARPYICISVYIVTRGAAFANKVAFYNKQVVARSFSTPDLHRSMYFLWILHLLYFAFSIYMYCTCVYIHVSLWNYHFTASAGFEPRPSGTTVQHYKG